MLFISKVLQAIGGAINTVGSNAEFISEDARDTLAETINTLAEV